MGRPIKKTYFGNLNTPPIGGEGVSATITVTSTGTRYSQGSVAVFSSPQLPDGVAAEGTLTIGAPSLQGRISAVTLTSAGSGYTSTATISITTASRVASTVNSGIGGLNTFTVSSSAGISIGMLISGASTGAGGYVTNVNGNVITSTVNNNGTWTNAANLQFLDIGSGFQAITALTASTTNAIAISAYVTGGSSAVAGDIIKQEASRRYLVKTAQGQSQCKLVTAAPGAGEMTIEATDSNGSTYYVKKLTMSRAVLIQKAMVGSYEYVNNQAAGWTLGAASTGIVSIASN